MKKLIHAALFFITAMFALLNASAQTDASQKMQTYRVGIFAPLYLDSVFTPTDVWNITGGFNVNRFGNPQGFARWNTSMNMGVQRKLLAKKLSVTANVIDPFVNQQRRVFTYGTNFNLESFSLTQTRNFRLSVAYNFTKTQKPMLSIKK